MAAFQNFDDVMKKWQPFKIFFYLLNCFFNVRELMGYIPSAIKDWLYVGPHHVIWGLITQEYGIV